MELKKEALSGVVWTSLLTFGSTGINFFVSLIMARLLEPAEFGLIGMLSIFIAIGSTLMNAGLTLSLVRSQNVNNDDFSTVFYFNLIASVFIYFIIYLAAPFIAEFYNVSELQSITRVYCVSFIFSAFGAVQQAILTRNLEFKKITLINIPALLISSVTGIILALKNYGVWSLVWASILNSFFISIFLWTYGNWKPSLVFVRDKFFFHFNFGYKLSLSGILEAIYSNIYNIVIGKQYNQTLVGYYTRSITLRDLPLMSIIKIINTVIFPLFSKVQDDIPRFKNAYKSIMQLVIFIIAPLIILMGVLADPLFIFLFSEKWKDAIPIFQILCFSGILLPIHSYNLVVLQIKGRTDLYLKLEIIKKFIITVVLITSMFFGLYALLWGQLLTSIIALFINSYYSGKMLNYSLFQQIKDLIPIILIAVAVGAVIFILNMNISHLENILRLLICGFVGGLLYFLTSYILRIESIKTLKELIKNK